MVVMIIPHSLYSSCPVSYGLTYGLRRVFQSVKYLLYICVGVYALTQLWVKPVGAYGESFFTVPADMQKRVEFWQSIFTRYGDDVFVIHDRAEPWRIIDFVFFDRLSESKNDPRFLRRDFQSVVLAKYMARYRKALDRFEEHGQKASGYGEAEREVYMTYQDSYEHLERLYKGETRIRAQRGLAHSFWKAAYLAQDYLPYFEKEFRDVGMPIELTRLAFVESMFNPDAISKVGASGMWQFMKATARSFLKVNYRIDERHSPLKAARAAALLLKSDYAALQSWPLAVSAYNHGRGGILRATRVVGTRNLADIIVGYKSRAFGFASQNFYAEFLAAVASYRYLIKKGRISVRPSRLDIMAVTLRKPTQVKDLSVVLGIKQSTIQELNQCINKQPYTRHASYVLPKNYRLYVPRRY